MLPPLTPCALTASRSALPGRKRTERVAATIDPCAGARVAAYGRLAGRHGKRAESRQPDVVTLGKALANRVQYGIDGI